ncbi:hypothetical protein ACIOHC_11080 [Streptomyces sp. NPDC088252]|uniref:hypothetical protein n=1 Tax=unclassified Streptomyces TaxID=2593676 RepID=UPI0037F81FDD
MSRDQTTTQWLRAATNRIATGSARICLVYSRRTTMKWVGKGRAAFTAIKEWLGESDGIARLAKVAMLVVGALILRKVFLGLVTGLAHLAHSQSVRWLLWPATVAWLIAAYRVGHPDWEPPADPEPEPDRAEESAAARPEPDSVQKLAEEQPEPTEAAAPPVEEPPLPSHQDLHEALSRVGTPHAHIAVLAEDLGTTAERVRAALDQLSIPVEAVRMRGRGSSTGVRADRFPTPVAPSVGVVGAGQSTNNDNNNTVNLVHREGLVIAYTDDETNPVRTHVHVKTDA